MIKYLISKREIWHSIDDVISTHIRRAECMQAMKTSKVHSACFWALADDIPLPNYSIHQPTTNINLTQNTLVGSLHVVVTFVFDCFMKIQRVERSRMIGLWNIKNVEKSWKSSKNKWVRETDGVWGNVRSWKLERRQKTRETEQNYLSKICVEYHRRHSRCRSVSAAPSTNILHHIRSEVCVGSTHGIYKSEFNFIIDRHWSEH